MKAAPSRRSPTASFRPIRKPRAARTLAAPYLSIASWPAPTAGPTASTPDHPSCRERSSKARNLRKARQRAIATLSPRSINTVSRNIREGASPNCPMRKRTTFSRALRMKRSSSKASTAKPSSRKSSRMCSKDSCRPAVWRQPRHGRVEDDRLPRRALQLSRLGRSPQRALSAAAREHHGPHGLVTENLERGAMSATLTKKDVVIVGLGWTGSIMANELTDEGLDVIAIERGPWRDTPTEFPPNYAQDELRYRIRHELFLRPEQTTFTFRNKMDQPALPIRDWGSFMPPNGVGGGGVHWNAETFRFLPSDFVLKTHLTERYGASFLPQDMTIQDWGVTYDDLEQHYDAFEYLTGTCGTAGNLRGQIQEGGNPFEGPRSRPYPNPAQAQPFSYTLVAEAARELGHKPFPQPSGNMSKAYTNPLGIRLGPCTYCGFCEWFGCGNYSKASPLTCTLPVLIRKSNFAVRDNSEVTRINTDRSGKRATGVTFVDTSGEEWEQPADLVILSAFTVFNVQLLLLSKIGQPYDPVANKGVIGRNFTHQTISDALGFFDN